MSTHLVCGQRQRRWGESQPGQGQRSVCVCVGGGGVGGGGGEQCVVCGVPCVRAGCEPAGWVCVSLGSGCVCARCAGGVCVRVCVWCVGCRCGCGCGCGCGLWVRGVVAQRQRPRDTARQRTRQCVCVRVRAGCERAGRVCAGMRALRRVRLWLWWRGVGAETQLGKGQCSVCVGRGMRERWGGGVRVGPRCVRGLGCLWAGGVCVALGAGGVCVSTHLVCGQRQRRWGESQPGQGQRSVCVCVCVCTLNSLIIKGQPGLL